MAHAIAGAAVRRVLDELKGVQDKHGYWVALCPVHNDSTASLSIAQGDSGAVLKCHAGCETKDILDKLGLSWGDTFDEKLERTNGNHEPDPRNRERLVKTYDYTDEHGKLLFQACRFEPKTFKQRRPDEQGEWIYNLKQTRRVLYHLPDVLEAVAMGRTVYLVEGEKDADALIALGYCATTNAMGAGKWRDEYAEVLAGTDVVILPDNDVPGAEHAEKAAASLVAKGARVRVVQLPELPAKGDVSDWIGAGHTAAEFDAIVERTASWSVAQEPGALAPAMRAIDLPPPRPIEWIVGDLFTAGEIGLLVGDGGSFKSTAAINLAAAIAGGYTAWNRFSVRQRPALIISAEDSLDVVLMRLNAFVVGHQWDRTTVLSNIHLFTTTEVTLSSMSWQNHIISETKRIGAGYVVLDPFAELIDGDENSNSEIRPIVKFLRRLGRETGAAVNVVHHAGKQGQDKRALDRIRGASALPSAARSILFFDYQPNGAGVVVEHLKMSRTPRLDRFVLSRSVVTDPGNRAHWQSATLAHTDARSAAISRAESFVLAQVTAAPRTRTTNDLRTMGRKNGLSNEEVGTAMNHLEEDGKLGYEPGPKGSKKWYPITQALI